MEQSNNSTPSESTIWSNTTLQFSKAQVTALSISADGRKAVIGGKKSLYLIDLEKFNDPPQTLKSQKTPLYDVNQIKWSTINNVVASTNNQVLNIWDINDERFALQAQVQAHRRPIHDLNWNTFEPNLLTTASLDGYIFLWDTRDLKKPAKMKYFKPGGTCSQVKWNRYRSVILAGSSGGEVRVWDIRNDVPLVSIRAESADIVTLDWSYTDESELLTASHTNNIKFWCIDRPRTPTGTLITPLAVSRAKFSPFGFGVVALSNKNVSSSLDLYSYAPQETPKGPNNISIIQNYVSGVAPAANKASITTSSVACLSPDRNAELTSFDWRIVETNGYREYQILALSKKDHSLKFIPISAEQQKACGYEPSAACVTRSSNCATDNKENNTNNSMLSLSLDQEFSLIKSITIPNILIEKVSSQTRSLIITAQRGKFLVQVKITFPSLYPIEAPPAFEMLSNISPQSKAKIKEALVGTAQEFVEKNCNCIEPCLRKLSILLEQEELSNQTKPAVPSSVSMPAISVSVLGGTPNDPNLPSNMTNYMVKAFDTLASIALTFGMNIAELRSLNKIHHSSQLLPGQNLIVYKKAPTKGKISPRGDTGIDKHLGVKRSITAVSRGDSRRQLKMSRDDSHISEVKHDPSMWQHAKQKSNVEMKHKFKPSLGSAAVHKAKVKFIDMSNSQQISSISGILTITTTQFIFEPDLDQYAVWERGVLQYTIFNEMTNVISCEVVNSDMFFEDDDADKGTWRFDDEHANALLQVCMDEVQKVTNSKILHFLTPRVKARELNKAIEQWITRTKEKSLMESLNLDSPFRKWTGVNMRRNSVAPSKTMIGKRQTVGNKENAVVNNAQNTTQAPSQPAPKLKEEPRRLSFFEKLTGRRSSKPTPPISQAQTPTQPAQKTSIINSFFGEWEEVEAAEEPSPNAPVAALTSHISKTGSQVASAGVKEGPPAAAEEDDWLPVLLDDSKLLSKESVKELWDCVPNRFRYDYDLRKLFSTDTNGTSLITFFSRMRNQQPSLIIIRDENQYIFGGFASAPWETNPVFYGTGESFVFALKPEFNAYKWTKSNNMFMYAQRDGIAMGGGTGGHYGFWIDSEFNCGTSEVSKTFLNRRLSASEEFKCSIVEVWGLVKKK